MVLLHRFFHERCLAFKRTIPGKQLRLKRLPARYGTSQPAQGERSSKVPVFGDSVHKRQQNKDEQIEQRLMYKAVLFYVHTHCRKLLPRVRNAQAACTPREWAESGLQQARVQQGWPKELLPGNHVSLSPNLYTTTLWSFIMCHFIHPQPPPRWKPSQMSWNRCLIGIRSA